MFGVITGHLHWTRRIPPPRQRRDRKLRTQDRQVITKVMDVLSVLTVGPHIQATGLLIITIAISMFVAHIIESLRIDSGRNTKL